jgi:hypothetical protein
MCYSRFVSNGIVVHLNEEETLAISDCCDIGTGTVITSFASCQLWMWKIAVGSVSVKVQSSANVGHLNVRKKP